MRPRRRSAARAVAATLLCVVAAGPAPSAACADAPAFESAAAAWAWDALCAGRPADFSPISGGDCAAAELSSADAAKILTEPTAVDRPARVLACVRIEGGLDLAYRELIDAVLLRDVSIEGDLSLHRAAAARLLAFEGGSVSGDVDAVGARLAGGATIRGVEVGGDVRFGGLRAVGDLDLRSSRAAGDLSLEGAAVSGAVALTDVDVGGRLQISSLRVGGTLAASGARSGGPLSAHGLVVEGDAALLGIDSAEVALSGARIAGRFGLSLARPDAATVRLDAARIGVLGAGVVEVGDLDMRGADAGLDAAGWIALGDEAVAALIRARASPSVRRALVDAATAEGRAFGRRTLYALRAAAIEGEAARRASSLFFGHGVYWERALAWAAALAVAIGLIMRRRLSGARNVVSEDHV